jgi:MFS family permease
MAIDPRRFAIAFSATSAFLHLYAPQATLPLMAQEYGVGAADASKIITAGTLAVAATAPFTGALSDVLGRKRVIVVAMTLLLIPATMAALAPSLDWLIFWRFVHGLLLPPIFAVTLAYIGDEWPPAEANGVFGVYASASAIGGFLGRFIPGMLAAYIGWRGGFLVLAFCTCLCLIGFGELFNLSATLTYLSFHLSAPPFNASPAFLGSIFVVYLVGSGVALWLGPVIAWLGRRTFILCVLGLWAFGILITLSSSLVVIVIGLIIVSTCGILTQATSNSFVATTAKEGTSSAVGLYVTCFYIGGTFGGWLPGVAYESAGWPAVLAMVVVMIAIQASIVATAWKN